MPRTLLILCAALLSYTVGDVASAQVQPANPAKTWIYAPNVTVIDLWRGVRNGQIEIVSSATAAREDGGLNLVTVFRGARELWRCAERVDSAMVEQSFACARLR